MHQSVKPIAKNPKVGRKGNFLRSRLKGRVGDHPVDWLDACNGLFGEGETEGNCPEQFTLNINWAPTHTLKHAGLRQRPTAQPSQNDSLPWSEILEDSQDFDLEVFNSVSLEDGFPDSSHPRANVLEWEELLASGGPPNKK